MSWTPNPASVRFQTFISTTAVGFSFRGRQGFGLVLCVGCGPGRLESEELFGLGALQECAGRLTGFVAGCEGVCGVRG